MNTLKLLKTRRAWLKWLRDEYIIFGIHNDQEPPREFPCWAFAEVENAGMQYQRPVYLYRDDLEAMLAKLKEE